MKTASHAKKYIFLILFLTASPSLRSVDILECIFWRTKEYAGAISVTSKEALASDVTLQTQSRFSIDGYKTPVNIGISYEKLVSIPTLRGLIVIDAIKKEIKQVGNEFGAIVSGIPVLDGYVIGTYSGNVIKLSKFGHEEWKLPIKVPEFSQFLEFGGSVIVCDMFGAVTKIDVKSGEILKRKEGVRANIFGAPVPSPDGSGIIFATFPPESLCKLNCDLETVWRVNLSGKPNCYGPAFVAGNIFVETDSGGEFFSSYGKLLRRICYNPVSIFRPIAFNDKIATYDKDSRSILIMSRSSGIVKRRTVNEVPKAIGIDENMNIYMMKRDGELLALDLKL